MPPWPAACASGGDMIVGDMTRMQSEAESEAQHLESCPQTGKT